VSSYFDLELFLSVFVTLMVIMNPPGAVPIFLGLTASLTHKQRDVAARPAALVALGVIAAFAVFGQQILTYLHISLAALQGDGWALRGDPHRLAVPAVCRAGAPAAAGQRHDAGHPDRRPAAVGPSRCR
jgi:Multiple antibiotic transporter